MRKLEYVWRLFGTGLSFVLFGLGGIFMSLTVFPLINIFIRDPARRSHIAQRLVHLAFQIYVRFMVLFGVIGVEVKGAEVLEHDVGTLIVSNHPSLLDVVLLMSLMRRAQCIVKYEIWQNPFMRGVVTATGYISNDDDPEALIERCARALGAQQSH
ncbi:lysophospholipid acyltransferase family protein, partial [Aerococcus mictus]|uniref:lysophospholipid acyltransferase family protein n=1 Tax=Aerococcus mictus TaxID=2976810 RepID=UPI002FD6D022